MIKHITQTYSGTTGDMLRWQVDLTVRELSDTGVVIRGGVVCDLVVDHLGEDKGTPHQRALNLARAIARHERVVTRYVRVSATLTKSMIGLDVTAVVESDRWS